MLSLTSLSNLGVIVSVTRSSIMKEEINRKRHKCLLQVFLVLQIFTQKRVGEWLSQCGSEDLMFGSVLVSFFVNGTQA